MFLARERIGQIVKRDFHVTAAQGFVLLFQVGAGIAVPLLLCVCGADYLRKQLSIGSWLIVTGILLGIAGGMLNTYLIVRKAFRQWNRDGGRKR